MIQGASRYLESRKNLSGITECTSISVLKPKPKRLQQPIITNYEARENAIDQVVICFSFQSDWLRISARVLGQSQSGDSQTKTIPVLVFFENHLKISLLIIHYPFLILPR